MLSFIKIVFDHGLTKAQTNSSFAVAKAPWISKGIHLSLLS